MIIARALSDPTSLLANEPGRPGSHSATEVLETLKRLNEDFLKTSGMVTQAASYAQVTRRREKRTLLPPG